MGFKDVRKKYENPILRVVPLLKTCLVLETKQHGTDLPSLVFSASSAMNRN
jgi:hypothetical protein